MEERFKSKEAQNWLKCISAEYTTKDVIAQLADLGFQAFYTHIRHDMHAKHGILETTTCSSCSDVFKQCNLCLNIGNRIWDNHRFKQARPLKGPSWSNTDSTKWCTEAWELAKCYMPPTGYKDKTSAATTDFNGIIGALYNCTWMQIYFTDDLSQDANICTKARQEVNRLRHMHDTDIDDGVMISFFDCLFSLLYDHAHLKSFKPAVDARKCLIKLLQNNQTLSEKEVDDILTKGELDAYKMTSNPRGWCVIINNQDFYTDPSDRDAKAMRPRMGTLKDAENLTHTFKRLGFIVQRHDNLTSDEMQRTLDDASHNDHSKFDCFVCCILTHGGLNHLYGANSRPILIKELTSVFQTSRCPSLAGKPKLFFLQACQGEDKMEAGEVPERDAAEPFREIEVDTLPREMLPNESDFLLGNATVPGYVSFRNPIEGSWYIRKLCEYLGKYAHKHHLLDILTEVNREVAKEVADLKKDGRFKQIPAPTYTLRKRLYLTPI